jgi:type 2 lantibiotic biosynthesis protein LanM
VKRLGDEDLRAIVAKASSIDERVAAGCAPVVEGDDGEREARWAEWREVLVKGDAEQFARRLAWDGLDEETVRPRLGAVRPPGAPLPRWAAIVAAAVDGPPAPVRGGDPAAPLPFEELLTSFVDLAARELRARCPTAVERLAAAAHARLERSLLRALAENAAQALHLEFSIERAQATSPLDRALARASDAPPRDAYEAFVLRMRGGGLRPFFLEYAVLARQLGVVTELWIEAGAEFLRRLDADAARLDETFGGPLGPVVDLDPALSDPHAGRRMVMALTFASGARVVYKPKDIGAERAYYDLVAWLNARGGMLPLRTLKVLAGSDYGWTEFAAHAPCADAAGAARYFERAGALLCLMYVLEAVDCHRDNIVASGDQPLLVDCEGLLQPRQRLDDMADGVLARFLALEQLSHSVLRSGMLPHWQVRGTGKARRVYDISALGGFHDGEEETKRLAWTRVNTDAMDLGVESVVFRVESKGPRLEGRALGLQDHCDDVIRGFRAAYALLARHRDVLAGEDGPIGRLAREKVRFIYRDTQIYALLAQRLRDPEFQRDGIRRAIQLDLLCRPLIPAATSLGDHLAASSWWPVFGAERRAMQREDVPYFGARPTENALYVPPDERVPDIFQGPSFAIVQDRLRALSDEDQERQVRYIVGSLYGRGRERGPDGTVTAARDAEEPAVNALLPDRAALLGEALRIADAIAGSAVRARGDATWVAPQFIYRADRYLLSALQNDLYTGLGGVAMFLASAAKVGGAPELATLATDSLRGLRDDVRHRGAATANNQGVGGARGLGSTVYALTHVGRTLGDASLLDDARAAARLITEDLVAEDATYDLFEGVAGAILALTTLYQATGDASAIARAEACAAHLARRAVPLEAGRTGWKTLADTVILGMSHGIAGIACALARLHAVTGDPKLLELARASTAHEDAGFDEAIGNWPDLRAQAAFTASWCHGGPGIALARIGGLRHLDGPTTRTTIERGLALTMRLGLFNVDYTCCGNMGLADILAVAGRRLGRPELTEAALRRAWAVVVRARTTGGYLLDPMLPKAMTNPTLFQGTAGIGYTLVGLAVPDVPCALLWE